MAIMDWAIFDLIISPGVNIRQLPLKPAGLPERFSLYIERFRQFNHV